MLAQLRRLSFEGRLNRWESLATAVSLDELASGLKDTLASSRGNHLYAFPRY